MEEDLSKHDVASELDYIQAQAELDAHKDDALELCVHIQPLTITRLDREGTGQSRDVVVNMILHEWLYEQGE